MLVNERSFDRLFCDVSSSERFDLYYNQRFSEDPVFNHVVIDDRIMDSSYRTDDDSLAILLHEIRSEAERINVCPTIFVEKQWSYSKKLEEEAVEDGYGIAGMMEILSKEVTGSSLFQSNNVVETKDYELWNDIFMRSFSLSQDWKEELLKRERMFLEDKGTVLLVAMDKSEASGCTLLHRMPLDYLGVYCVGTLPEGRGRGIATSMLRASEGYAANMGCKYLTLQTVQSDGVTPMYISLGYRIDFERDLLRLI